jgi:hypothetical protein
MLRIFPPLCAVILVIASGVAQRVWTGAWTGPDNEPAAFAARLANVPLTIGDWQGTDVAISPNELAGAEAVGHVVRRYVRPDKAGEVSLMILCGRPGPISLHPPSVCYGGIGFEPMGQESHYKVENMGNVPEADFCKLNLIKPDRVAPAHLRIYYAWNAGGDWRAPASPRLAYGGAGALYKMYLVYRPAPGSELAEQDPCQDFLRDLLPELHKALSPAS